MPGGYAPNEVCQRIGLSLRQLVDYAEKRVVIPAIQNSRGQGNPRSYSAENLIELWIAKQLVDAGLSVRHAGTVLNEVRGRRGRALWQRRNATLWLALDQGGRWRFVSIIEHQRGRLRPVLPATKETKGVAAVMGFDLNNARTAVGLT